MVSAQVQDEGEQRPQWSRCPQDTFLGESNPCRACTWVLLALPVLDLLPVLHKDFQKLEENTSKSSQDTDIILTPKPDKYITEKTPPQTNTSYEYEHKLFNKIVANWIQLHVKGIIYHDQVAVILGMQGWFSIWKAM